MNKAGRPAERDAEALRNDMLSAGLQRLRSEGFSLPITSVSLAAVIDAVGAPQASAYRAWRSDERKPQEEFHHRLAELLLRNVPGSSDVFDNENSLELSVEVAVSGVLDPVIDGFDSLTYEERSRVFRDVYRSGADADYLSLSRSSDWAFFVATATTLTATSNPPPELYEAWKAGEQLLAQRYQPFYEGMAALFGFRLRYCYTWEHFTVAAAATVEGLALRSGVNDHLVGIRRATGPDGAEQEWTLFAVCFEALLRQFFEPDPDNADNQSSLDHEVPPSE